MKWNILAHLFNPHLITKIITNATIILNTIDTTFLSKKRHFVKKNEKVEKQLEKGI